jgi:hypothetical protein
MRVGIAVAIGVITVAGLLTVRSLGNGGGSHGETQWWRPGTPVTWQVQYVGEPDLEQDVEIFVLDGTDTPRSTVDTLHARGGHAVCYVSVGSWEDWRPDAEQFPAEVLGDPLTGWPGERWLDIRRQDILLPLMERRFAACRDKGFDGVEPDNIDAYANRTGFSISADDQMSYNLAIADMAHRFGMAVGLKNDPLQADGLQPHFDFAVVESCLVYGECDKYRPFIEAGKPVLHVEYGGSMRQICRKAGELGFSTIRKNRSLDAFRRHC